MYYSLAAMALVAIIFAVLVSAVMKELRIPFDLDFKELDDDELPESTARFFQRTDQAAAALGFAPLMNFTMANASTENRNRVYLHDDGCTALLATVMVAADLETTYHEFGTVFLDGVDLLTNNSPVANYFDQPEWRKPLQLPAVKDLAELHSTHMERVLEQREISMEKPYSRDKSILGEIKDSQEKQLDHQVEKGLLKRDDRERIYLPTLALAMRGVEDFVGLDDTFGKRMLQFFGALLGFGVPLAGVVASGPLFYGLAGDPSAALMLGGLFALAGTVAGSFFERRPMLWGFVFSLPALLFHDGGQAMAFLYSLLGAQGGSVGGKVFAWVKGRASAYRIFLSLLGIGALLLAVHFLSSM